jgi:hypothetical protein
MSSFPGNECKNAYRTTFNVSWYAFVHSFTGNDDIEDKFDGEMLSLVDDLHELWIVFKEEKQMSKQTAAKKREEKKRDLPEGAEQIRLTALGGIKASNSPSDGSSATPSTDENLTFLND